MGLGEQVGPERAPARVEALRVVPEADEHLLHDLLRERPVAGDAQRETEGRAGVAPVRLGQRLGVEAPDRDDQGRVGGGAQLLGGHGDIRPRGPRRMAPGPGGGREVTSAPPGART